MIDGSVPMRLTLPAPAKLNHFLHVVGRRADGYHELQTLFQLLEWGDEITLETRTDGHVERSGGLQDVAVDDDLVVRAARLLQPHVDRGQGVTVTVVKRVPVGAGLGGGSSDAATVLLGLNRLWNLNWSLDRLADRAVMLGADVPVFVRGRTAFAEGIGDRLSPVDLPEQWFVVVWPGVSVATPRIFQAPELTRNTPALTIAALSGSATRNDLEPVAIRHAPVIADALEWLGSSGDARMSGSGSSVFAAMADETTAVAVARRCPWQAWAVRGTNRSPVHAMLGIES